MNNYADIEYSKELAWLFKDAEWWWKDEKVITRFTLIDKYFRPECFQVARKRFKDFGGIYPAITTDMALEVLIDYGIIVTIKKFSTDEIGVSLCVRKWKKKFSRVANEAEAELLKNTTKSLPNALCKMISYLVKEGIIRRVGE